MCESRAIVCRLERQRRCFGECGAGACRPGWIGVQAFAQADQVGGAILEYAIGDQHVVEQPADHNRHVDDSFEGSRNWNASTWKMRHRRGSAMADLDFDQPYAGTRQPACNDAGIVERQAAGLCFVDA